MHINDILDHPNLQAIAERFHTMYDRVGENECWLWKRAQSHNGYGLFTPWHKQQVRAHRMSYVLAKGPIPREKSHAGDGTYSLQIRHRCHNPLCVNPKHLVPGTAKQNSQDKIDAGRNWGRGEDNYSAVLTEEQVASIRSDPRRQIDIAADYGVKHTTISRIKRGVGWKHVRTPLAKPVKHLTGGKGENNGRSKLTEKDVRKIRRSRLSSYKLAELYNVSHRTILLASSRKTWAHVT